MSNTESTDGASILLEIDFRDWHVVMWAGRVVRATAR